MGKRGEQLRTCTVIERIRWCSRCAAAVRVVVVVVVVVVGTDVDVVVASTGG